MNATNVTPEMVTKTKNLTETILMLVVGDGPQIASAATIMAACVVAAGSGMNKDGFIDALIDTADSVFGHTIEGEAEEV